MAFAGIEVLTPARHQVGESPLWSPDEQALYWVDIDAGQLWRWDAASGEHRHWTAPERLACLALRAGGGLIGGLDSQLAVLEPQDDGRLQLRPLAQPAHPAPGMRFNDGRADREGRFWAGTMVRDMSLAQPAGRLYRWDAARGLSQPLVEGLVTPNGLAFSPDGRRMYLSDSHPSVQAIWRYTLAEDGTPHDRQLFVDMQPLPGRPDGAAVDVDGCYWICGNDAGQLHRFTPDGRLDRSIALPVSKPAMCSFGGERLDQLFVTSIRPAQPAAGFDTTLDGAVLVLSPGVQGLAEHPCEAP